MYIEIKKEKITILYCNTFLKRLFGMMFKKRKQKIIYCFPKCNSIHTFFMFQNIDVIMTDKENKIMYTYQNIKPNCLILPKKNVYYTYEFSHNKDIYNQIKTHGIKIVNYEL